MSLLTRNTSNCGAVWDSNYRTQHLNGNRRGKDGFHRPEQENDPGLKAVHNPDVSSEWENTELPSKQAFGSGFLQKHSAKLNRQGHAIRVKLKP